MPPLPNVPNVVRIFIEGFVDNADSYRWGNVFYYEFSGGPPTATNLSDAASNVKTQWTTNVAPLCPSPTHLTDVKITDLTSPTSAEGFWSGDHAGTRGDDSIPANAAMLVSYPASGFRYRGGHPRSYVYAFGNADLDGAAHWSGAAVTETNTNWNAFLTAISTITQGSTTFGNHVGVRYKHAGTYLPTPIILTLGPGAAQSEMASQRRRIGRRKHKR